MDWRPSKPRLIERIVDWFVGTAGILLAFSVIPIIPLILMFRSNIIPIVFGPIDTRQNSIASFGIFWLAVFIITALLFSLSLWINEKVDKPSEDEKKGPSHTLSPDQVSFISVYEAYKELKIFFVSHLDRHVNQSVIALQRGFRESISPRQFNARQYKEWALVNNEVERMAMIDEIGTEDYVELVQEYRVYPSLYIRRLVSNMPIKISIARSFLTTYEKYPWFEINLKAKNTLQAFVSLNTKLLPRLIKREDLPAILSILKNLSMFLYAFIPEHRTYLEADEIEKMYSEGNKCLDEFVTEVNNLSEYPYSKEKPEEEKEITKIPLRKRFQNYFHGNVFIRFAVWFLLVLILTSGAVYIFNLSIPLTPDTMATVIISTSVASAAALAAFLPSQNLSN